MKQKFSSTKFIFTIISMLISFIALLLNKLNGENFTYIIIGLATVYQSSRAITDIFQQKVPHDDSQADI